MKLLFLMFTFALYISPRAEAEITGGIWSNVAITDENLFEMLFRASCESSRSGDVYADNTCMQFWKKTAQEGNEDPSFHYFQPVCFRDFADFLLSSALERAVGPF